MDPDLILQKTAKGREEIEKRTYHVDAKRRTLLILIDGRSTVASLAEKTAHIADAYGLLDTLLAEGFIEPAGGATAGAGVARPGAASPSPAQVPTASLEELKRIAVKAVERLMGPDGDSVALKLERAGSMPEFMVQAQKTREILSSFLGPRKAEEFWKSLGL